MIFLCWCKENRPFLLQKYYFKFTTFVMLVFVCEIGLFLHRWQWVPDGKRWMWTAVCERSGDVFLHMWGTIYSGRRQTFLYRSVTMETRTFLLNTLEDSSDTFQWRIQDFPEGAPTWKRNANLLFGQILPKTGWKWKNRTGESRFPPKIYYVVALLLLMVSQNSVRIIFENIFERFRKKWNK